MPGRTAVKSKASRGKGFTDAEKSAMRQRVKELQSGRADGETDVLEAIRNMAPADRAQAERIHKIVRSTAPALEPKTWYGMPAYARAGKVVCDFKPADKFKTRYATLEFQDQAQLDDGNMWPVAYALKQLTAAEEAKIAALVKKAAG